MQIHSFCKLFISAALLLLTIPSFSQSAAINTTGAAADASAMLEISSTSKGLLPPRLTGIQRDEILSPATGLMLWCTNCGSSGEMQVYNGNAWTNISGAAAAVYLLNIGDNYQGGKIGYILVSGDAGYNANVQHGLIAAPNDLPTQGWGCYNVTLAGAMGTAIGTGSQNTANIVSGCAAAGIAARVCDDLDINGKNDWYLPVRMKCQNCIKTGWLLAGLMRVTMEVFIGVPARLMRRMPG